MEIISLENEQQWEIFLMNNAGSSGLEFLASPQWADIMKREGKTVLPLAAIGSDGEIKALFILIKEILAARFFYWYAPRGPIFKIDVNADEKMEIIKTVISKLKIDYHQAVFLKIEPAQDILTAINKIKLRSASDIQPQKTLVLNLKDSASSLLAAMHQKTRYNIRLAEKKGVRIVLGSEADFPEFWRLLNLTGERDGFRIHSAKHYKNLIAGGDNFIKIFFAEYEGQKIATALVSQFGTQATYLHGASDNKYRNVMAPYLLQWEIIKRVQSDGALIYDFYGINEKKWPGVTRFKRGFGGEVREYFGVYDLILRPVIYQLYQGLKRIKRLGK